MADRRMLRSAVCIAALMGAGTAQADVTAAQVWEDWKEQMALYGEDSLSIGAEEASSGSVTVRDLAITFSDDEVDVVTEVGDIVFAEQGDGTVLVTMEESYPIVVTGADGAVITIDVTQSNLEMVVSGDPDAMSYAVSADSYGVAFRDIKDGDVTIEGDASLIATGISGGYTMAVGEMRQITSEASIDSIDILVDFQMPGGTGEYVTGAAKLSNLTSRGDVTMPLEVDMEAPEEMFAKGFSIDGGYQIGGGEYVFDINSEGEQAAGSVSSGPVSLTAVFNKDTIAYTSSTQDVSMSMQASSFPLPIELSMAQYGVGFQMPLGVTEEPAPFGLSFDLVDLEISEMIWSLFDPAAVLPRDPATLQIGLSGTAKALIDILDPANAEALESEEVPFEPYSLSLDTLRISAAGALVTGSGAFTFDNEDTQTFAPMPRPEGDAIIEITGLNKLLDNLVAMGLVPADQIMGPRMMMGMFARATGDDQMEIAVEVTPSGQVNVNGNRVR